MATTNLDFRKIDYDQLIDKPIVRTTANVDTITNAGVYDRGDGKRFLVYVNGNTITQIEESFDGYRTRSSLDWGIVRWEWDALQFSDASHKWDVVVISDTEPSIKRETTAWIDTSDWNKFKVYDGTKWLEVSGQASQIEEMPEPTEALEGKIVQYDGETTADFTHGYFYECVSSEIPGTYEWVRIDVQPIDAENIHYDNTVSWLTATTIQEAIDEIAPQIIEYYDYSAMQWPCEEWYHIPSIEEWRSIINTWLTLSQFKEALHIPQSWQRSYSGSWMWENSNGIYWSYSVDWVKANYLMLSTNPSANNSDKRAYWFSLRAFKDMPVIPDLSWNETVTDKVWYNEELWLISILVDTDKYVTIKDKNEWATVVWNNEDALTTSNRGKYFQRGNNHWFSWGSTWDTSSTRVNAWSYWPSEYESSTFITYNGDWSSVQNDNLWGSVTGVAHTVKKWYDASDVIYDNTNSWLNSTNVQDVIDEVNSKIEHNNIQVEKIPTASEEYRDIIIQYKWETTSQYKQWYFYKCVWDWEDPETFNWINIKVQDGSNQVKVMPTPSVENVGQIIQYAWDTNNYYTHGHFYEVIEDPENPWTYIYQEIEVQNSPTQAEEMEDASEDNVGKIIQYVGETDENFTHGYFYECVSDGEDPATYSWVNVKVQSWWEWEENIIYLTEEEYALIPEEEKLDPTNNYVIYWDEDPEEFDSKEVEYDNTWTTLTSTNVQDAINELYYYIKRIDNITVEENQNELLFTKSITTPFEIKDNAAWAPFIPEETYLVYYTYRTPISAGNQDAVWYFWFEEYVAWWWRFIESQAVYPNNYGFPHQRRNKIFLKAWHVYRTNNYSPYSAWHWQFISVNVLAIDNGWQEAKELIIKLSPVEWTLQTPRFWVAVTAYSEKQNKKFFFQDGTISIASEDDYDILHILPTSNAIGWAKNFKYNNSSIAPSLIEVIQDTTYDAYNTTNSLTAIGNDYRANQFRWCINLIRVAEDVNMTWITSIGNNFKSRQYEWCSKITIASEESMPNTVTSIGNYFRAYQYSWCELLTAPATEVMSTHITSIGDYFRAYQYQSCNFNETAEEVISTTVQTIGTNFRDSQYRSCININKIKWLYDLDIGNTSYRINQFLSCNDTKDVIVKSWIWFEWGTNPISNKYVRNVYVKNEYLQDFIDTPKRPWYQFTNNKYIWY